MRLRLAIYGAASLVLLAFYAPARALTSLIAGLRDRWSQRRPGSLEPYAEQSFPFL